MDFQKFVDTFHQMACVMSVEKLPDGKYGKIRMVAGNKPYVDSIENNPDMPQAMVKKFVPDTEYEVYFPKDKNFELVIYGAAVLKKPTHSYVHPERFDFYFNQFYIPLEYGNDNLCYCTYIQEITRNPDSSQMSKVSSDTAAEVLNACIKLRGVTDFKQAITDVVKDIREICGAKYCAILSMDVYARNCSLLCESCDPDNMENYKPDWCSPEFYEIAKTWDKVIGGSNCVILQNEFDLEYVKEKSPVWYESLKRVGVKNLVLFPLKFGSELLGYIWANNYNTEKVLHIKESLELTTYFLASEISGYQMFDRFRILSTVDLLTGLLNRNEMNNRLMQLSLDTRKNQPNIGIIYADLNGLKQMNDTAGHSAGDDLIKHAAEILKAVFGNTNAEIYRAGGDEFMVLLRDVKMQDLEKYNEELKENASHTESVRFATGLCIENNSHNIYDAIKSADTKMYEDKELYYSLRPELKRR